MPHQPDWKTTLAGALLVTALAACGAPSEVDCTTALDCASGLCGPTGQCLESDAEPMATGDDGPDSNDAPSGDADDDGAAGDPLAPQDDDETSTGICQPNRDGSVTRSELYFTPGLTARFALARDVTLSSRGEVRTDGSRVWRLDAALPGDAVVERGFGAPQDAWWYDAQAIYSEATHTTLLAGDDDLVGTFRADASTLALLGAASAQDGLYATELTYDPPLTTLAFPLSLGDTWTSHAVVSGWATGVFSLYWEDAWLDAEVDASGELVTELATFPVLRVRSTLTRQTGVMPPSVVRSFSFVSECYGTVAWMVGQANDTDDELSDAAEVARIVP